MGGLLWLYAPCFNLKTKQRIPRCGNDPEDEFLMALAFGPQEPTPAPAGMSQIIFRRDQEL
jgi:hypothetical protein